MAQNNQALFDALMAGGCGGTLERWITSSNSSSYDSLVDAVEAFATAVDAAIPTIGGDGPSISQINLLQSIAQGIVAGRNLASIDADTFAEIAASIAAVFNECESRLNNEPTISGGGGGGGSDQIPFVRWLDKRTTVSPENQDGSYSKPFATASACLAALLALEATGGAGAYTMMVWPGDYLADGVLEWEPEDSNAVLVMVNATTLNFVVDVSQLPMPVFNSIHAADGSFFGKGIIIQGENGLIVDNGTVDIQGCQVWFKCQNTLAMKVQDSHFIAVDVISGSTELTDCILQSGTISQNFGTSLTMRGVKYSGTAISYDQADPANIILVDSETNYWMTLAAPNITNGTVTVMV